MLLGLAAGMLLVGIRASGVGGSEPRWLAAQPTSRWLACAPLLTATMTGCTLRQTTGIACFACGGTRSLAALSRGHFDEALRLNPLLAAATVALLSLGVVATLAPRAALVIVGAASRRLREPWVRGVAIAALLVQMWHLNS